MKVSSLILSFIGAIIDEFIGKDPNILKLSANKSQSKSSFRDLPSPYQSSQQQTSPSVYKLRSNKLFKEKLEVKLQILRNAGSKIKELSKQTPLVASINDKRYSKLIKPVQIEEIKQTEESNPFEKASNIRRNRRNLFKYDASRIADTIKIDFKHPRNIVNPNEGIELSKVSEERKISPRKPSFYKSNSNSSRRNIFSQSRERSKVIREESVEFSQSPTPKKISQFSSYWANRRK